MTFESIDELPTASIQGQQSPSSLTAVPTTKSYDPEKQGVEKPTKKVSAFKSLGWLDRFLAVWILLAMIIGILLGNFVPQTGPALQKGKFVGVSVPIGNTPANSVSLCALQSLLLTISDILAVGLLVMMYPILCKVRYETLYRIFQQRSLWLQIGFSVFMNWIIAPFLMVISAYLSLNTRK
jgi:ACR3 family arsenite transporter